VPKMNMIPFLLLRFIHQTTKNALITLHDTYYRSSLIVY